MAVLLHERLGGLVVAGRFDDQDLTGELDQGRLIFLEDDGIVARLGVEDEGSELRQVVVHHDGGLAVSLFDAEADASEESGQGCHGGGLLSLGGIEALADQEVDSPKAEGVGLEFFDWRVELFEGLPDRGFLASQHDLARADAVHELVQEGVREVADPIDEAAQLRGQDDLRDRIEGVLELPLHVGAEQDFLGADLLSNVFVVRQVEGARLDAGVGVTRGKHHVDGEDRRAAAPRVASILLIEWDGGVHLVQVGLDLAELRAQS